MRHWTQRLLTVLGVMTLAASACTEAESTDNATAVSNLRSADGLVEAVLSIDSDWGSGYRGKVTLRGTGSGATSGWTVVIAMNGGQMTGCDLPTASPALPASGQVTVRNASWNGRISASSPQSFGFSGAGMGRATIVSVTQTGVSGGSGSAGSGTTTPPVQPPPTTPPTTPPPTGGPQPPPIQNGCSGYATRFWDCCKPHCGWSGNVPSGVRALNSCSAANQTLSSVDVQSSCNGGSAHMCYGLAPFAVNGNLAYGYAATSSGDVCGRCYQLQFTGSSFNAGNDPGSRALSGKTMIVQAVNIGFDVGNGQFDLLVPGGGVGAFNACSSQWGVSNADLGVQYGGFLAGCKQRLGHNASLDTYKTCVRERCNAVFARSELADLRAGCHWFVDWFQAADNPSLRYKEVACPAELTGESGMNRSGRNDISTACGN